MEELILQYLMPGIIITSIWETYKLSDSDKTSLGKKHLRVHVVIKICYWLYGAYVSCCSMALGHSGPSLDFIEKKFIPFSSLLTELSLM